MKGIILSTALCLLFILPARAEYVEVKNLTLPSEDISKLVIDCGAGFLDIRGDETIDRIEVAAEIVIEGMSDKKARDFVEKRTELRLKKRGDRAYLTSRFEDGIFSPGGLFRRDESGMINLTIKLPRNIALDIDDGSGRISIENMEKDIVLDDGSGAMEIFDIEGDLDIDDGSGSIDLRNIAGSVRIQDGSGEIDIDHVSGKLFINDGSGSISARDIKGDVDIDDGSGEIVVREIDGDVVINDGSGSIRINGVSHDVDIINSGSGSVNIANVSGRVRGDID
jgi:DUF4097 and DUF4098 domain-containing protein YvlB